mmetsp:Transcript_19151/g.8914  ORF Transcript_19151/g.8914 Transcript_19151/m.8914 type:complete len:106 (+) Transcript_19151:669-986(+)
MQFSGAKKDPRFKRFTQPKRHGGRYFHTELRIEQSIHLIVPNMHLIRPSMVISFELFLLKNARVPYDKIVGHGFFPLLNADFEVIEGMFKVPILRGEIDKTADRF